MSYSKNEDKKSTENIKPKKSHCNVRENADIKIASAVSDCYITCLAKFQTHDAVCVIIDVYVTLLLFLDLFHNFEGNQLVVYWSTTVRSDTINTETIRHRDFYEPELKNFEKFLKELKKFMISKK